MVRFVKVIGILIFLGFLAYMILPGYNTILEMMNSTAVLNITNMTALEYTEWKLLPVIMIGIIVVAVIWHYFRRKGESE